MEDEINALIEKEATDLEKDKTVHKDGDCNCISGQFCNWDNGPNSGFCETCSDYENELECENDDLTDLGVEECKS